MIIQPGVSVGSMPMPGYLESVNVYLLWDEGEACLVDTGMAQSGAYEVIEQLVAEAGLAPGDVTRIILTHAHRDHAGLVPLLRSRWGTPVCMHSGEHGYLSNRDGRSPGAMAAMALWLAAHGMPEELVKPIQGTFAGVGHGNELRADRLLQEGDCQQIGRLRWQVLWTPGHSPGHICLWEPTRRLLITGDHVLPDDTPNISVLPGVEGDPLGRFLSGLDRVARLPVHLALPGHGQPFSSVIGQVEHIRQHHERRSQDIVTVLAGGTNLSTYQVASRIPWVQRKKRFQDLQPVEQRLAFGETLAHLEYLAGEGRLRRVAQGGWAPTQPAVQGHQ